MSFEALKYTRAVKRYDRDLLCDFNLQRQLCIFRKTKRFVPVCVDEGFKFLNLVEAREYVFALTDNWSTSGRKRAWGVDFVLNRLREVDLQAQERFFEEMDAQEERVEESKRRSFKNEAEAWASDNRRAFQKATEDVLVHSLSKDEPKKRLKDRSIKNG